MGDIHSVKERAEITGLICTQYAYFDYLISNIIWYLLNIDKPTGIIVIGSMDIRPKIDMAINLSEHTNKIEEIRKLLQKYKNSGSKPNGFISKRNKIVHGIFSSRDGDPTVMVESHRKKKEHKKHPMEYQYMLDTHTDICNANNELVKIMEPLKINIH